MSKVTETGLSFRCFVSRDWLEFALDHRVSYCSGSQRHRMRCLDLCGRVHNGSAARTGRKTIV